MSLSDLTTLTAAYGFTERNDPFQLFAEWLADAEKSEPNDPNGMALATVDEEGLPNVRMVLLKNADDRGFVFYTNYESQKGQEILGTMRAALCFHWKSLRRQVRVRGLVEQVTAAEADAYFVEGRAERKSRRQFPVCIHCSLDRARARIVPKDNVRITALERQHVQHEQFR